MPLKRGRAGSTAEVLVDPAGLVRALQALAAALDSGDELGEVELEGVEDLGCVVLGAQADLPLPAPGAIDDVLRRTLGLANELMLSDELGLAVARLLDDPVGLALGLGQQLLARSLTIQRACLISSGIVDRIWSSRS